MKLICDGLELSDAIGKVSKALPQRVVNPVLEGIKITAEGETLTLYATDSEFSVERKINAEIIEEGEILVPGRIFSDYIKKLTDEQIELSETEKNRLRIRYNESEGYLQCLDKDDYPDKADINREKGFHILESELKDVINKTLFSASTDDSRQILKGCLFEIDEYTLTVVALDGYRLALAKKALEQKSGRMSVVIPSRALNELSKLLGDGDKIARLFVEENLLVVEMENTTVSTRLLVGEYINYCLLYTSPSPRD